jgi:hypothetical protein
MIRKLSIPILTLVILWTIILCIEKQVMAACFLWVVYSALQFFRRE